jgi:hypothetical protein
MTISLATKTELGELKTLADFTSEIKDLKPNRKYYVRAYATNEKGTAYGESVQFTTAAADMKLTTLNVTQIAHNAATSGGTVTDYGGRTVKECGVCWSTGETPTTSDNTVKGSISQDKWSCRIEGLIKETKYYARAYVVASDNTVFYGESIPFTTTYEIKLPTLSQVLASDIQTTGVTLQCKIMNNGDSEILSCGFCWSSTNMEPTTNDGRAEMGTPTNTFKTSISSLQDGTKYYIRAYATNALGTAYSETIEVTTISITTPVWGFIAASAIGKTKATIAGTLTSNGNADIVEMGICWGTNSLPTIYDSKQSCAVGSDLSVQLTGLRGNTFYYVRAYAQNSKGISYSNEVVFTTLDSEVDVWDGSVAKEFGGGTGTESDPIWIETAAQLKLLADRARVRNGTNYSGVYFKLMSHIDLADKEWMPIGHYLNHFKGNFDGNNLSIIGLRIVTDDSYKGLFGYISAATIANLKVSGTISSKSGYSGGYRQSGYSGMICGRSDNSNLIQIETSGSIAADRNVGGICGWAESSNFTRIETSGSIVGNGDSMGGICGYASGGSFVNCTNLADVQNTNTESADSPYVGTTGGICGDAFETKISNSINSGNITGSIVVGGIVGDVFYVTLSNCCNYSNVHGSKAGGIFGSFSSYNYSDNSLYNCFWLYEAAENVGIENGGVNKNGYFTRSNGRCRLADGSDLVDALNQWVDDNDPFPSIYRRWEYKVGSDGFAYPVLK